jgi:hypothetical protein
MDTERLLREVGTRLAHLSPADREETLDALREEIARERRRGHFPSTVEVERERREEAETLRDVLDAINRQATLEQTIEEVLKQLSRIVAFDSCSVALLDPDGAFRIIASRGFPEPGRIAGITFRDPLSDALRNAHAPVTVTDVSVDDRFLKIEGTAPIRSWAGVPLLVEGDVIGLLCLDRHRVETFEDEELHRAKAVAFSAAAAIRKAQLLEKLRRYATLMERVVHVDEAVFAGRSRVQVEHSILEGALRIGGYPAGVLLVEGEGGPRIAAVRGDLPLTEGEEAPANLAAREVRRLGASEVMAALPGRPPEQVLLVPLVAAERYLGTLALVDPNGESPDDRLLESYASRAAAAYRHALQEGHA